MITSEEIKNNYNSIREQVDEAARKAGRSPEDIQVIPVSKTHPVEVLEQAVEGGLRVFGENYAQEMKEKYENFKKLTLPDPYWHFIGHLQRNKVKYIAPFVNIIHSVDSERLAREISKQAKKNDRTIDILLQINTSGEESKSGIAPVDTFALVEKVLTIENIKLKGLMTIAGLFSSNKETRGEFQLLKKLLEDVNKSFNIDLQELSMGMTGDFDKAVEEGATMVRIGTAIFGERDYSN